MATATAFSAMKTFIEANWNTATAALVWENDQFEPPAGFSSWINLEVFGNQYDLASLGTGSGATALWRERGSLVAFVFARSGTGSLAARTIAEAFAEIFKGAQAGSGVRFEDMSLGGSGVRSDDGNWWGFPITVEWIRN